MNHQTILRIVTYVTAGVILVFGIAILTGYLIPEYVPKNFRIIMGSMMVLFGIYRIAIVAIKSRQAKREDEK